MEKHRPMWISTFTHGLPSSMSLGRSFYPDREDEKFFQWITADVSGLNAENNDSHLSQFTPAAYLSLCIGLWNTILRLFLSNWTETK